MSSTISTVYCQANNAVIRQTCDSPYRLKDTLVSLSGKPLTESLETIVDKLVSEDYLETGVDSVRYDSLAKKSIAYLHIGPKYDFESLQFDSLSQSLLERLDIEVPTTTQTYLFARKRLVDYYADRGYPFAQIRLEGMHINQGVVEGALVIDEGKEIIMDSLIIKGDLKIRQGYLRNYLDVFSGERYNHTKVQEVRRKLDKLNFVTVEQDPELSFINNYASLNLYLKAKNSSRFDLIFGVIPTNNVVGRQLFLSLDFTTELLNKLGYGEYIYIDFERLRPEQQRFNVKFNYPYILDTPFAFAFDFDVFRNALDYQNLIANIGAQYAVNTYDRIKVSYSTASSKIIEVDSVAVLSRGALGLLPERLSVSQVGMAIEFDMSRLDYRFNPRKGYSLNTKAVISQRKVLIDPGIINLSNDAVDFESLYDQLDLVSPKYQLNLNASLFRPIARRGAFGLQLRGGYMFGPELLENEVFQIGGNQLLRGFDEASIFTSYYAVTTVEYRLLLAENSYFSFPFVDIGYVESDAGNLHIGMGGGLIVETKAGMFNFAVAVGRNDDTGFDFGRPKAHFGFISLF